MAILIQKLSSEIFEILKSYGKTLILYDNTGNVTYDPEKATRMYIMPEKMMLSITQTDNDNEVKLYLSKSVVVSDQMKLINTLRQLCTRLNTLFNVRRYGKELSPKDFAYQVTQEDLHETYWGTQRTSYSTIGNCKLIFHHNRPVNEEKRGARSRNIKNIYIENSNKEKILLPTNNTHAARALARHISSGGKLYDKVGDYIIECSKEYDTLKNSLKCIKGIKDNTLKENTYKSVRERMRDINKTFDIIRGSRNYKRYNNFLSNKSLYEFTTYNNDIENELKLNLPSDELSSALPYIVSLMSDKVSLLPSIQVSDSFDILDIINNFTRKFKYGIDYVIKNNTIIIYNPNFLSELTEYLSNINCSYDMVCNQNNHDNDQHITNSIEVDNISDVISIMNMEMGLEPNIDYIADGNKIDFLSSDIYANVCNLLNTTNINYIEIQENQDVRHNKDKNMAESSKDKILDFATSWVKEHSDNISPEDISERSTSLAKDLKHFMSSSLTSISGIDKTERKFTNKRAEQAYKISAITEASGLHGDMLFNFLVTISEKIANSIPLDSNEKAVASKAIKLFDNSKNDTDVSKDDIEERPETSNEIAEDGEYTNTISISWDHPIKEELISILTKIPFGKLIGSSGNSRKGYINYDVPKAKEELFRRSVRKYVLNYDADHIVKVSEPTEYKKPKQPTLGRWKDFLGFKEEAELEEWFNQFDPEKSITEEDEEIEKVPDGSEEDFEIDPDENDDEIVDGDGTTTPTVSVEIDESVFDPKDEGKLAQDIDFVKSGGQLTFAYIDNGGTYTIYEEETNTPIKDFSDEEVADKLCDVYNGRKYDQAKSMVLQHLEDSLEQLRKDHEEAEFTEQEIREMALNRKINEYAKAQYSPSYEVDVNRVFGTERRVPVSEEFSLATLVAEELFRIASKNVAYEGIQFNPSIFEETAIEIFKNEIKPRLLECGFEFDPEDTDGVTLVVVSPDTCDYDSVQSALYGDLEEDDNQSPIDVARRMGYDAAREGDTDKYDSSLRSLMNNQAGDKQREDIHKAFIAGMDDYKENRLHEKDLGKKGKNFSKIAKSAGKEYHSKEAGEKVAGAVLSKLRKEHPEEYKESYNGISAMSHILDSLNSIFEADDEDPYDIARRMGYDDAKKGKTDTYNDQLKGLIDDKPGAEHNKKVHDAYDQGIKDYEEEHKNLHEDENDDMLMKQCSNAALKIANYVNSIRFPEDIEYDKETLATTYSPIVADAIFDKWDAQKLYDNIEDYEIHDLVTKPDETINRLNRVIRSERFNEDEEDETLNNPDVTIPTDVQDTMRNDVSSDVIDNNQMDMINDLRRRAGLLK